MANNNRTETLEYQVEFLKGNEWVPLTKVAKNPSGTWKYEAKMTAKEAYKRQQDEQFYNPLRKTRITRNGIVVEGE